MTARAAWSLTCALAALILVGIGVQYGLNQWNRYFFDALEAKDAARVFDKLEVGLLADIGHVPAGHVRAGQRGRDVGAIMGRGGRRAASCVQRGRLADHHRHTGRRGNPSSPLKTPCFLINGEDGRISTKPGWLLP